MRRHKCRHEVNKMQNVGMRRSKCRHEKGVQPRLCSVCERPQADISARALYVVVRALCCGGFSAWTSPQGCLHALHSEPESEDYSIFFLLRALYVTQGVYSGSVKNFIMYNDQQPDGEESSTYGHSKAALLLVFNCLLL
eukprot:3451579-Amphidinium_carterae.1